LAGVVFKKMSPLEGSSPPDRECRRKLRGL
jgi:hypothetical protein